MMNRKIRVRLSKDGEWIEAQLLQIIDGWVEVDIGRSPFWVMHERCHPDDMNELARRRKKKQTKRFDVIKVDDPPS